MDKHRSTPVSRRLDSYWKMERGCAFVFPPLAFAWVRPVTLASVAILALALIACCSILWVGAAYWRAVWARLETGKSPDVLRMAERWKPFCLAATIVSLMASAASLWTSGTDAASLTALGFSILAVLEYVNYYHVQLQNFDHGPTFRRFLTRRRFPRAHLARDLELFRKSRR